MTASTRAAIDAWKERQIRDGILAGPLSMIRDALAVNELTIGADLSRQIAEKRARHLRKDAA